MEVRGRGGEGGKRGRVEEWGRGSDGEVAKEAVSHLLEEFNEINDVSKERGN